MSKKASKSGHLKLNLADNAPNLGDSLSLDLHTSGESEEDLETLSPSALGKSVVFATDWTSESLVGQLAKGNIKLDPTFQRRDAWTPERKSRFIESIILGLPIPQIVLAEAKDFKGSFVVIDGKQRLLSLQQFAGINLVDDLKPLVLKGLKIRKELNGKTYEDLKVDTNLHPYLTAFENQTIRTVVVRNWQKEDVLYLIFHRLNSESLPLSAQELRQALHPGLFMNFAVEYSEKSKGLMRVLNLNAPDFRMRDVELLVRHLSFRNRLSEYKGNLKKFLDETCAIFNKQWAVLEPKITEQAGDLEAAIDVASEIFGDNTFRKFDGKSYERTFNRAVFDVVAFYFADSRVRLKAVARKKAVKDSFEALCVQNLEFRRSVESTTKSREAVKTRFLSWGNQLGNVISLDLTTSLKF
jgi:hypothetical protein